MNKNICSFKLNYESNRPSVRTHISVYDNLIDQKNTIEREKEKESGKNDLQKIIAMSIKHHKILNATKDYNNKYLFHHSRLKNLPSKVKLTQYQIYENNRNKMLSRNEILRNGFRTFNFSSERNEKKTIKLISMSSELEENEKVNYENLEKIKSFSFKGIDLPKIKNFKKISHTYNKFNNSIYKLKQITKNLKLEYTRLHFRK